MEYTEELAGRLLAHKSELIDAHERELTRIDSALLALMGTNGTTIEGDPEQPPTNVVRLPTVRRTPGRPKEAALEDVWALVWEAPDGAQASALAMRLHVAITTVYRRLRDLKADGIIYDRKGRWHISATSKQPNWIEDRARELAQTHPAA